MDQLSMLRPELFTTANVTVRIARTATTGYGSGGSDLPKPLLTGRRACRWSLERPSARPGSVDRQGRVDLLDPGQHPAADVDGVGEARLVQDGEGLGRAR